MHLKKPASYNFLAKTEPVFMIGTDYLARANRQLMQKSLKFGFFLKDG